METYHSVFAGIHMALFLHGVYLQSISCTLFNAFMIVFNGVCAAYYMGVL